MNYLRHLKLVALVAVLAPAFTNCSSDSSSGSASTSDAGSPSGEAGQGPVTICGKPATVSECDPITASQCDIANGETCDHSASLGGFKCFPGPNSSTVGQMCGDTGPFCGPSTACNTDIWLCEHYCCSDADCGLGRCFPGQFTDGQASIGVCLGEYPDPKLDGAGGADDGAAGSAGAGG
jgi:hypothetical protein